MNNKDAHLAFSYADRGSGKWSNMAEDIYGAIRGLSKTKDFMIWLIGTEANSKFGKLEDLLPGKVIPGTDQEVATMVAAAAGSALQGGRSVVIGRSELLLSDARSAMKAAVFNQASMLFLGLENIDSGSLEGWSDLGPGVKILAPADGLEAVKFFKSAMTKKGSTWMAIDRNPVVEITTNKTPAKEGKAVVWKKGSDVAVVGTGSATLSGLLAAEKLVEKNVSCRVIHMPSLFPWDEKATIDAAKDCGCLVVIGQGATGGLLAHIVAKEISSAWPVPIGFVAGNKPVDTEQIVDMIQKVIRRKRR